MSANFYELLKYAATGMASPSMTYYDKLRASTLMGGATVQTLTGIPPLSFKSDGTPLISWSMKGNGSQQGTPTPDNPIMPEMCGVRTGNVLDISKARDTSNVTISQIENGIHAEGRYYFEIPFENESGNYYLSWTKQTESGTSAVYMTFVYTDDTVSASVYSGSFTLEKTVKTIRVYVSTGGSASVNITNIMLNPGSTALPYEPYGWKVPFENHGENLVPTVDTDNGWRKGYMANGVYTSTQYYGEWLSPFISVADITSFTISAKQTNNPSMSVYWFNGETYISQTNASDYSGSTFNSIPSEATKFCFAIRTGVPGNTPPDGWWVMLNPGSTPKPYSPYLNETIPVYLGEVPTMRRVKKLVLTGEETWYVWNLQSETLQRFYTSLPTEMASQDVLMSICSHFETAQDNTRESVRFSASSGRKYNQPTIVINRSRLATVDAAGFKAYLASEYAAGHPVTIWYVLANEQTGISNEPLCKIGDYADELHSEDASVTIPTVKGQNTLTVDTPIQPSEMAIRYRE